MAGFKFRTRTKSKYDRPQPQTFIEQMTKQLYEKNRSSRSLTKATSSNSKPQKPVR